MIRTSPATARPTRLRHPITRLAVTVLVTAFSLVRDAGREAEREALAAIAERVEAACAADPSPAAADDVVAAVDELRAASERLRWWRDPRAYVAFYEAMAAHQLADWGAVTASYAVATRALDRDWEPLGHVHRWEQRMSLLDATLVLALRVGDLGEMQDLLEQFDEHLRFGEATGMPREKILRGRFFAAFARYSHFMARGLPDLAVPWALEFDEVGDRIRAGSEDDETTLETWFFVARLRLFAYLDIDRPERAMREYEKLIGTDEYADLPPDRRLSLDQCAALAEILVLRRDGRTRDVSESPMERVLTHPDFPLLPADMRAHAYLVEAGFQLSRSSVEAARDPYHRWRELVAFPGEAPAGGVAIASLAFRASYLSRSIIAGEWTDEASAEAELTEIRGGLRRYLARARHLAADEPIAILHSAAVRDLIVESCFAELALFGDVAIDRLFADLDAVEAIGPVARLLGAATRVDWRSTFALPDVGGIVHVPGLDRGLVLFMAGGRAEIHEIAATAEIDSARGRFERTLGDFIRSEGKLGAADLADARRVLEDILLPPTLRQRVASLDRLVVIAPELLGHVPFEFLEATAGLPVGIRSVVEYWPSLSVQQVLRQRKGIRETGAPLALLARTGIPVTGVTTYEPFHLSDDALSPWTKRIANGHIDVIREHDATVDWLVGPGRHAGAWWIIAHGVLDPGSGPASGLALGSADGAEAWLRADDPRWRAHGDWPGIEAPELVVLAACGAWRAPFRRGNDGAGQLPTRFLESGARAVLLPYHDLRFADHQAFAAAWLEAVAEGATDVGSALRDTRKRIFERSSDPLARIAPLLFHVDGLADTPVSIRAVQAAPSSRFGGRRVWGIAFLVAGTATAVVALLAHRRRFRVTSGDHSSGGGTFDRAVDRGGCCSTPVPGGAISSENSPIPASTSGSASSSDPGPFVT